MEAVEDGTELALDFLAGDELQDQTYQLLLSAEIAGTENREMVQAFTEQMLEDLVMEFDEAPVDVAQGLEQVRAVQAAVEDALVPIMTGLVPATGLMEAHD